MSAVIRIVVGAAKNDENCSSSGHARVYEEVDGSWLQIGSDVDGESEYIRSGRAVAMSPDGARIVVGAPWNDGNGYRSHARVFVSCESRKYLF